MKNNSKEKNKSNERIKSEEALLKFLRMTKNGKYAQIEESSLEYSRTKEETEYYDQPDEEYYYSIT